MAPTKWIDDTLRIAKTDIPVRIGEMPQADLRFYPENPRIYSFVKRGNTDPSQATIERSLIRMDHVKKLVQSIKANGGLTDPLIVRDGDFVVLEGNSRLAAYRALSKNNAIKWGKVKVKLLPKDISDALVFALLGEYHIIGRKDWAPYEQAGYLWRRNSNHGVAPQTMADEMGLSTKAVNHLIRVYEFMVEHKDEDVNRWSYYDELLKSRVIQKARDANPDFDKVVVRQIKGRRIDRAADIRDKLAKVARAGGKALTQFVQEKKSLEDVYKRVAAGGAGNEWVLRLKRWRGRLLDPDTKTEFGGMQDSHKKTALYELKKIKRGAETLIKRLE